VAVPVDPLDLERRNAALAGGVVERIAAGAHRGDQPRLARRPPEGQRGVLPDPLSLWWTSPAGGRLRVTAIAGASTTRSAFRFSRIDQPTILREYRSITRPRKRKPSSVGA
jgi:hypothetical protein